MREGGEIYTLTNILKMFSLYRKKTVFFAGLVLVLAAAFYVRGQLQVLADQPVENTGGYSSSVNQNLNILGNGSVILNNQKVDQIAPVDGKDELRRVIVNQPKNYMDSVTIRLSLPATIAYETDAKILAVHGVDSSNTKIIDSRTIEYTAYGIGPEAEITVVAKMPVGSIEYPLVLRVKNTLAGSSFGFWLLLAVVLPLLSLFVLLYILFRELRGKVDIPDRAVSAPPMSIPPAVVGLIAKQKIGPREIAATLVDLAVRGDIVIVDRERGFVFGKNHLEQSLLGFEKVLLGKIFKNSISSTQNQIDERVNHYLYSKKISAFYYLIQALALRMGYLRSDYRNVKMKYSLVAIGLFLLGVGGLLLKVFSISLDPPYSLFFWIGMIVSSVIIFALADYIPSRTPAGQTEASNWLAFKRYLTDPNPVEYDERNYDLFVRYLPYAIVLECEAAWAQRFSKHSFIIPDWFLTESKSVGLEDFCLLLFPIVSYVGRNLDSLKAPGI